MKRIAQVAWKSPSNIAFVKYWGKYGEQLPQNPSLSMTLDKCFTETSIELYKKETNDDIEFSFLFEGKENKKFSDKINAYLNKVKDRLSFLPNYKLAITSKNSFPHSAGIASSASAMSALALCLVSIEQGLGKTLKKDFYQLVSELARLGSGSASRSVFSEYSVWGKTPEVQDSSNNYAKEINIRLHKDYKCLRDVILLIDTAEKKISSSVGHSLMKDHPYAKSRFASAKTNLNALIDFMQKGNFIEFAGILEHEALSLHAMMMTATPWYTLLSPNTLIVMEKIRQFRNDTKAKITFTLDAGPNVHVIYPASEEDKVKGFIKNELILYCSKEEFIVDNIGTGPELLVEEFS